MGSGQMLRDLMLPLYSHQLWSFHQSHSCKFKAKLPEKWNSHADLLFCAVQIIVCVVNSLEMWKKKWYRNSFVQTKSSSVRHKLSLLYSLFNIIRHPFTFLCASFFFLLFILFLLSFYPLVKTKEILNLCFCKKESQEKKDIFIWNILTKKKFPTQ